MKDIHMYNIAMLEDKMMDNGKDHEPKDLRNRRKAHRKKMITRLSESVKEGYGMYLVRADQKVDPRFTLDYFFQRSSFHDRLNYSLDDIDQGIIYTDKPSLVYGDDGLRIGYLSRIANRKIKVVRRTFK